MQRVCGMNPMARILYLSGILDHPGIQYEPRCIGELRYQPTLPRLAQGSGHQPENEPIDKIASSSLKNRFGQEGERVVSGAVRAGLSNLAGLPISIAASLQDVRRGSIPRREYLRLAGLAAGLHITPSWRGVEDPLAIVYERHRWHG